MLPWLIVTLATISPPPAQVDTAVGVTSSPSEATATVSPSTVTLAADRAADPARDISVSLGSSIAGGNFGSARDTSIATAAFGARVRLGELRLSASIPYMRIRSAGLVVTGIDSTPVVISADTGGRKRTFKEMGDLTLGAAYSIATGGEGPEFEVSGRVKLPTASHDSGLSTNKTDYSAGLQVTQTLGRVAPFASITYRVFGDSDRLRLRNGLAASGGASWIVGRRTVLLTSYHYAQTASRSVHDAHELFAGASRSIDGGRFRLTAFGTAGLSQGAAAASGGIGLAVSL